MKSNPKRVMARRLARELTVEECSAVSGGFHPPSDGETGVTPTGCRFLPGGAVICDDHEHESGGGGAAGISASIT